MAQTLLELGRAGEAQTVYRRTLESIARLSVQSIWSHATAASACLALGDIESAKRALAAVVALRPRPSRSEIDAVGGGLREVAQRLGTAQSVVDELLLALTDEQNAGRGQASPEA